MANGVALCVGVSRYTDPGLAQLPDAGNTAREIQKALDARFFPASASIIDPGSNGDLFLRIQKAVGEAKGGTFFFYFAGHALRRGTDLLLATRDSEVDGAKGCVPWSDVGWMLKREGVRGGLVLFNVDQPKGAPPPQLEGGPLAVMGSLRTYDPSAANARIRSYADVMLRALQQPVKQIESFLNDRMLDGAGLNKFLTEKAPAGSPHSSYSMPAQRAVLREFPPEPVAPPPPPPPPEPEPEPVVEAAPPAPPTPEPVVEPPPPEPPPPEPVVEAAPPEPIPEPEPEPAVVAPPAPEPEPEPPPVSLPAPIERKAEAAIVVAPAKSGSRVVYGLLAFAAVIAAVLYELLR